MPVAQLEDRAVVAIAGVEARPFLQGLVTNDVERLSPGRGLYSALLTPQGKILFDFFLVEGDGAVLIDCAAGTRDGLIKRLTMYKLRAKIVIEPRDQLAAIAAWDGSDAKYAIAYPDPRLPELGMRAVVAKAEMQSDVLPAAAYRKHRRALGVPEGADFGADRMFALDAGLDELHAVSFAKGCYVGQELTARMKHRGTARKRVLPLVAETALPASGTALHAGGKEVGEIVAADGTTGFALIRLDRLEEAAGAPVSAGDRIVTLRKPSWLSA